jgi:hypothetical protein
MSKYIDILTLVNQCVNVVAHVAHTTAFWIKHLHYIDPQNAESRHVWIKHLPLHNPSLACAPVHRDNYVYRDKTICLKDDIDILDAS